MFETVLCLEISADLISLRRQRLEEDLAGGEKTVRKCLIMFGMYSGATGTCDLASLQRKFLRRPNALRGGGGEFLSYSSVEFCPLEVGTHGQR